MTSAVNDPFFANHEQWALAGAPASIDAPPAWCVATGKGVTVADVDTGADFRHPDLAGKLLAGAAYLGGLAPYPGNPTAGPNHPNAVTDANGHGTLTAGIIGADTDNGIGIAAVAPAAKLLIVKVLDNSGNGYDSDVANGIRWAADHGARVINVSIGPGVGVATGATSDIPNAVQYAASRNVAVAIAAGNQALPLADYLGLKNYALIVGALNPNGTVASYSDYDPARFSTTVSIYAPGGTGTSSSNEREQLAQNVVSTYFNGGYAADAGTSFATPQVAGTLALLMGMGYTAARARQRIVSTAVNRGGHPELDTASAVGQTRGCPASGSAPRAGTAATGPGTVPPQRVTTAPARPARHSPSSRAAPSTPPPSAVGVYQLPSTTAHVGGQPDNAPWDWLAGVLALLLVAALFSVRRRGPG